MPPQAVFFDMDGVTVDTAVEWRPFAVAPLLPPAAQLLSEPREAMTFMAAYPDSSQDL